MNGIVTFNAAGVRLDGVTAQLGGGPVRFGGRIGLSKYQLSEFDVTAIGENMSLRYPEGMRSLVDASAGAAGAGGGADRDRQRHDQERQLDAWLRRLRGPLQRPCRRRRRRAPVVEGQVTAAASNVRFDVGISAPSTLRIDNDQARIVARARTCRCAGTLDRPLLFGRADIERGEVEFEGRRYLITRGSLDFADANRIQPFFDIEAETRVRVPQQTYRVTMRMAGTIERMQPQFTSDPPLATLDILTLLFSDLAPSGDIELAGLQQPRRAAAAAGRGARHARADRRAVRRGRTRRRADLRRRHLPDHAAADRSVSAVDEPERQPDGARHDRQAHLGPDLPDLRAQPLLGDADQIILLEFDQSESLSWVLSQNEDRTYALEVRKRHAF